MISTPVINPGQLTYRCPRNSFCFKFDSDGQPALIPPGLQPNSDIDLTNTSGEGALGH